MLCEDYVVFEKVFMVVQLDPVGGGSTDPLHLRAFDELAMALAWLRAPSMQDDGIRRYLKELAASGPFGAPFSLGDLPGFKRGTSHLLPITAELSRELQARRAESPRAMMLYRGPHWIPCLWRYLDAQRRASLGPRTFEHWGQSTTCWEAQAFPWVEMPPMLQNVINVLRSRVPISDSGGSEVAMGYFVPRAR